MPKQDRNIIGRSSPSRIYEFGDKLHKQLVIRNDAKKAAWERSGKISGGKLGKPTLWVVLDMIGVPDEFDPYVLGKFQRGNDVEARAINFLTDLDLDFVVGVSDGRVENPGWTKSDGLLTGEFYLQKPGSYRGGVGFIDLAQKIGDSEVYHEIKSATKMSYDRVAASGYYKGKTADSKGNPVGVPQPQHAMQVAYYALGDDVTRTFLHYLNADDYRLTTFAINPLDYKEEIDKEIDDIQLAFVTKQLPAFETFLPWHTLKAYWSYKEWNELTPSEMMTKLKNEFPNQYKKFQEMNI